ncbi:MAG TPA: aconitate hydratase AcnA [Ktedonobacteraceae bacterium]
MDAVRTRLAGTELDYYALAALPALGLGDVGRLPMTVKILLEMQLRAEEAAPETIQGLAHWTGTAPAQAFELPFMPVRVLLHDYTGLPAVLDLAAMREAMQRAGKDPRHINPFVPVDLVIDHSVQVNQYGSPDSYQANIAHEYAQNRERFALLRWAQQAFDNFTLLPPGMGICHQINLEHLSRCVQVRQTGGRQIVMPDTLVGADSHTPMVNGLGVLGWGVGGLEAEACMLGQPMYLPFPVVIGVRLSNALPPGTTATDLVLTLTQLLRGHGVVNTFVEFCGDGLAHLSVADRATLANMCPEYGATSALFPIDDQTLRYLETSNRETELLQLVERYCKEQGLFRMDNASLPIFSELLELDLASIEPSVAGPQKPGDRVPLSGVKANFAAAFHLAEKEAHASLPGHFASIAGPDVASARERDVNSGATVGEGRVDEQVSAGSVVIAALTSCTNTSNPSVMIAAGLLAKRAVEAGLRVPAHVKTSLAPGSRVVTDYLRQAGLLSYLEELGFYLAGYGCTTCIGNSGPLASSALEEQVQREELDVVAVLSGNRNFEARLHPLVRAAYLASPPLVVAYALAGTVRKDLTTEPLGYGRTGQAIFLKDLWPASAEIARVVQSSLQREMFAREYAGIYQGDEQWRSGCAPDGASYSWEAASTYVKEPPFFKNLASEPQPLEDLVGARALVSLGDAVTTDHIAPAGNIAATSPAGQYLLEHGVSKQDFNTYGTRRGNYQVVMRGAWANIRLHNELAEGKEGSWTTHQPGGDLMSIFEAAERYRAESVPLIALAGKEYGTGSSRDTAAKGPSLLGVKAVIAESFERIHRSNLVSMGILPLQYLPGQNRHSLGLSGQEEFTIRGIARGLVAGEMLEVEARAGDVSKRFRVITRVDNAAEVEYVRHGGVLHMILRQMLARE